MKIEMISKAVICATSPLMYSGVPGMKFWEAATLQHDCSSPIFYQILSFVAIPLLKRVRQTKEKGLRRLWIGKAKRELLEKFDIVGAGAYRNSMNKFNEHGFTSTVEYIALRRAEIQAEYEERKKQIEVMFQQRERKCL